jgi:hypothetical protein
MPYVSPWNPSPDEWTNDRALDFCPHCAEREHEDLSAIPAKPLAASVVRFESKRRLRPGPER